MPGALGCPTGVQGSRAGSNLCSPLAAHRGPDSHAGSGLGLCLTQPGLETATGSGIWPWPQPQLRAGCLKPSTCRRWPLRERMSPAQSCCPARLQKLELQIHNSSGTPWLFVSCCEQMEELQIKPSAAREPIAFPTQPRRQQQRQGGEKKKKKKAERERERRSQPFLQGLSCHLSTPTCKKWGLSAGNGPFPGSWKRVVLSHHPWMLG